MLFISSLYPDYVPPLGCGVSKSCVISLAPFLLDILTGLWPCMNPCSLASLFHWSGTHLGLLEERRCWWNWKGNCAACSRPVKEKGDGRVFCANFCESRAGFAPCRKAWHSECYKCLGIRTFPMYEQKNAKENLWRDQEKSTNRVVAKAHWPGKFGCYGRIRSMVNFVCISQRIMVAWRWFNWIWTAKTKTNNFIFRIMRIGATWEEICEVNGPQHTISVPGKKRVKRTDTFDSLLALKNVAWIVKLGIWTFKWFLEFLPWSTVPYHSVKSRPYCCSTPCSDSPFVGTESLIWRISAPLANVLFIHLWCQFFTERENIVCS